jgi:hypothetical protein
LRPEKLPHSVPKGKGKFFRENKYPCSLEEKNILCNILFYPTRVSVLTQSVIFIYLTGGKKLIKTLFYRKEI